MEFRVLGPFEVLHEGAVVPVPAAKQRALLVLLLLRAGATVSGHRLIEDLWEQPPVSARKVLQTYVSKLRQVLPDGMLLIPGVLDSCTNYVEHPELVAQRLVRFAGVVGRENVIAGTDCGFSTSIGSSRVAPSIAWAKLAAMAEGARLASAELWA